jgi:hypothetical protein
VCWDVFVAQAGLQRAGIVALDREGIAAGVAHYMRMQHIAAKNWQ